MKEIMDLKDYPCRHRFYDILCLWKIFSTITKQLHITFNTYFWEVISEAHVHDFFHEGQKQTIVNFMKGIFREEANSP